jgi:hypothetical protein
VRRIACIASLFAATHVVRATGGGGSRAMSSLPPNRDRQARRGPCARTRASNARPRIFMCRCTQRTSVARQRRAPASLDVPLSKPRGGGGGGGDGAPRFFVTGVSRGNNGNAALGTRAGPHVSCSH